MAVEIGDMGVGGIGFDTSSDWLILMDSAVINVTKFCIKHHLFVQRANEVRVRVS